MVTKEEQAKFIIELLKGYAENQQSKQKRSTINRKYYQLHKNQILTKRKAQNIKFDNAIENK